MQELPPRTVTLLRIFFIVSALWNFAGAIPGLTDPSGMFEREFAVLEGGLFLYWKGLSASFLARFRSMEEPEENSEEAKRAKRIIYWVMAVFIIAPLLALLFMGFSG